MPPPPGWKTYEVDVPGGKTYEVDAPEGASMDDVRRRAFEFTQSPTPPAPAPAPAAPAAPTPAAPEMSFGETLSRGLGWGAVADTLGLGRPMPAARTPLQMLVDPRGTAETLGSLPANAALNFFTGRAGSKLLGIPAAATRVGIGAGEGALRGTLSDDPEASALVEAAKSGGAAAMVEGVAGLGNLGTGMRGVRGAVKKFEDLGRGGLDAIAELGKKYAARGIVVPTLAGRRKIRVEDAVQRLSELTGPKFGLVRDEIATALQSLEAALVATSPRHLARNAGNVLERFTGGPGAVTREPLTGAGRAHQMVTSPATISVAQGVAAPMPVETMYGLRRALDYIPGIGYLARNLPL